MESIPERDDVIASAGGSIPDIVAIIDSAKARGGVDALERFVAKALPEAEEFEVREAASVAVEIIESIPIFLARARQAGRERGLISVVTPLLDHAERYFLQPMDLIPEMTQGLPGLLDDSYLVIRVIENLDKGPEEYLDWDLDYPARFLARLMGPAITQRLDKIADQAMSEVSSQLEELWAKMSHPA
ncbi:MAG: hypothetical protein OEN56_04425 [Gemmatimonadota bacterium]|nr:hypothetical protein [Gemmatimonadota bacterium]